MTSPGGSGGKGLDAVCVSSMATPVTGGGWVSYAADGLMTLSGLRGRGLDAVSDTWHPCNRG
jgi:hypothetical protein